MICQLKDYMACSRLMKWSKSKDKSFMVHNTALLKTTTLVVKDVAVTETRVEKPVAKKQKFVEPEISENSQEGNEDDFYSMEELEQLENKTMAYWQESSRTSGSGETLSINSKVDPATVGPVVQGSKETEVVHLLGHTVSLDTRRYGRPQ